MLTENKTNGRINLLLTLLKGYLVDVQLLAADSLFQFCSDLMESHSRGYDILIDDSVDHEPIFHIGLFVCTLATEQKKEKAPANINDLFVDIAVDNFKDFLKEVKQYLDHGFEVDLSSVPPVFNHQFQCTMLKKTKSEVIVKEDKVISAPKSKQRKMKGEEE